jgi:hypothetical protein
MPDRSRRLFAVSAALAVVCAAAQALLGMPELALYLAPFLLIAGLLVSGRFLGEERIVARLARLRAALRRAPRRLPRPVSLLPLASLLARRVRLERGPPSAAASAA